MSTALDPALNSQESATTSHPVVCSIVTAKERKAAADFREDLKDLGFIMYERILRFEHRKQLAAQKNSERDF